MEKINSIFRIKGVVQHYDWGGNTLLPPLLNIQNPGDKPYAEYWLGAHQKAASLIIVENNEVRLDEFIRQHPTSILGKKVYEQFGRLPYLLKLLDVKDMLSIQVHPDKKSAEEGFAMEEKEGKPLNEADRNYKDDNHKPEIMVALNDFWLLHGFKPSDEINKLLQDPALHSLYALFNSYADNIKEAYSYVMNMSNIEVNSLLQPVLDKILPLYDAGKLSKNNPSFWAARAAKTFNKDANIDRGIFSIYLLNLVNIQPGDGIFQDAGILHAYLEGWNVELMANSDNVLRGGLTPKHIDVKELMKHVKFEAVRPKIIKGPGITPGEFRYPSPAKDFCISVINEEAAIQTSTADILFLYSGNAIISGEKEQVSLFPGEAVCLPAGAKVQVKLNEEGLIFRASTPK